MPICYSRDAYFSRVRPKSWPTIRWCATSTSPIVSNYTKAAAEHLAELLQEKGEAAVSLFDLARDDMAEAVEDAFRYDRLVLAAPTYNAGVFPFMRDYIQHLTDRNYQNRFVALIENGSWAPTAAKTMRALLENSKDLRFAETQVRLLSALGDDSRQQLALLAEELLRS